MCGRNSVFHPLPQLEKRFGAEFLNDWQPRYNITPSQDLPVIKNDSPKEIDQLYWGLLPHWKDEPDDGFINARAETAHEKPAFEDAWESRPCLILSSGFYEWKKQNGGPKQPYRIYMEEETPFALAGLWEEWTRAGTSIETVTILTTEPNDVVESIHNRMPVVLPRDVEKTWLSVHPDERKELCRPYPKDDLDAYPISKAVNSPDNDSESIIEPLEDGRPKGQAGLEEFG